MEKSDRFNEGKPKWSLVHYASLLPLVRVLEYGRHKYTKYKKTGSETVITGENIPISQKDEYEVVESGECNWKKGLDLVEIQESMMRHLAAIMDGELYDNESGELHIGHVLANAMMWIYTCEKKQNK